MASTTQTASEIANRRTIRASYAASSARFDLLMAALSALFLGGLWVDGWAHFHGRVDGSFFTPWHLVFYSAFAISALTLGAKLWRGISDGHAFARALPKGYGLSLAGIVIFGLGGVGDMVWHTLFGIEGGTEALLSPTHIMLGIGMALVYTGPIRSAWSRASDGETLAGWRALAPMLIGATLFLSLLMFLTSYAHPLTAPMAHEPIGRGGIQQDFGVTAILLESGLLAAIVGVLLYRWRLPVGAVSLMAFVSAALLTILVDSYPFLPALAVALLIVEGALYWLKPSRERPVAFIISLALIPALVYTAYFLAIDAVAGRVYWSVHVWTGAIVLAGVVGALIGWAIVAADHGAESK
ncbi:MAG: hypothetical protein IPK52_25800 [Chloroflexi bacterium]|nr:hypothetical protein [Chloroflexota bacterium]